MKLSRHNLVHCQSATRLQTANGMPPCTYHGDCILTFPVVRQSHDGDMVSRDATRGNTFLQTKLTKLNAVT
jgi:hypothetical protein